MNDGHWGIPKGIVEHEDSLLDTAMRETLEETGLNIKLLSKNNQVTIHSDVLFKYNTTKKTVYVFYINSNVDLTKQKLKCSSRIAGMDLRENDEFMWVDWETARNMVSKRQKALFCDENFKKIVDLH